MVGAKQLSGVNNPGWSFTDCRLKQLSEMYRIISSLPDNNIYDYKTLQEKLSTKSRGKILDGSKIRMFFPYLKMLGFIKYEEKKPINIKNIFTRKGLEFFKYIIPLYLERDSYDKIIREKIENIFSLYLCFGYYYMINLYPSNKDTKKINEDFEKIEIYRRIPIIISKIGHIEKKDLEFFIIAELIKKNESDESIKMYIENVFRKISDPEKNYKIIRNRNCKSYITSFLREAQIIKEQGNRLVIDKNGKKYFNL